jgi:hypothetical protein
MVLKRSAHSVPAYGKLQLWELNTALPSAGFRYTRSLEPVTLKTNRFRGIRAKFFHRRRSAFTLKEPDLNFLVGPISNQQPTALMAAEPEALPAPWLALHRPTASRQRPVFHAQGPDFSDSQVRQPVLDAC